jgi:hypothetical protein
MSDVRQFTPEEAIAFGNARAWEAMSFVERARFQMYQELLCMPFDVFHEAISKALCRDVWIHEFMCDASWQRLKDELNGIVAPPTMDEIIALIPEEKRIIIGDVGDREKLAERN